MAQIVNKELERKVNNLNWDGFLGATALGLIVFTAVTEQPLPMALSFYVWAIAMARGVWNILTISPKSLWD